MNESQTYRKDNLKRVAKYRGVHKVSFWRNTSFVNGNLSLSETQSGNKRKLSKVA